MRGHFIKVNGSYLTVVDPLPCAEYGAQSPASGSSYNQFEITKVDCETNLRAYPVDPGELWTALWMTIHIQRKSTTTCRVACSRRRFGRATDNCASQPSGAQSVGPVGCSTQTGGASRSLVPGGSIWCQLVPTSSQHSRFYTPRPPYNYATWQHHHRAFFWHLLAGECQSIP